MFDGVMPIVGCCLCRTLLKFIYLMMRGDRRVQARPPATEQSKMITPAVDIDSLMLDEALDAKPKKVEAFGLEITKEEDEMGKTQ